jgi:hypothetical protein
MQRRDTKNRDVESRSHSRERPGLIQWAQVLVRGLAGGNMPRAPSVWHRGGPHPPPPPLNRIRQWVPTVRGRLSAVLAGHGVAELIDPTAEDTYWREKLRKGRPYVYRRIVTRSSDTPYRDGLESLHEVPERTF